MERKYITGNSDRIDKKQPNIIHIAVLIMSISIYFLISINAVIAGIGNPVPDDVTNLTNNSYADNFINWTWIDPTNIDPSLLILSIYIDNQHITDVQGGVQYYNETNVDPGTRHTIGIQTYDSRGSKTDGTIIYASSDASNTSPTLTDTYTPIPTDTDTPIPTDIPTPTPKPTPIPITGNTYYVSTNGSDNNPGTQNQPFATIYRGISAASTGDTVQVLPGKYYPTYSTRPIIDKSIIVNGSGRDTIIDGSNITQYTDGWYEGLVEIRANNVYFGGFTVQNSISPDASTGSAGIVIVSDNNTVERNLIQNTFDSGIKLYGGYFGTNLAYNNTIRYNELYQVVWGGNSSIERNEALSVVESDTSFIYYNYIHETGMTPAGQNKYGGEGIDVYDNSKNVIVHHNYVYDGVSVGIYLGGYNITAYDNIAERITEFGDAGDGLDINAEQTGTVNEVNSYNNIIYNTGNGYAICNYHDPASGPGIITNVTLDSNIAYVYNVTDYGDMIVKDCGNNISNILIKNNFAHKFIIDSNISGAVTLSGNDLNSTDIANQFNLRYFPLKNDILSHVSALTTSNLPIQHVVTILFENAELGDILSQGPYFKYLYNTYGSASNYYAPCHPSASNYLAMTSGKTWQCGSDDLNLYNTLNIGDLLENRNLSWYGFMESMPSPCDQTDSGEYVTRHNPFVYYADLGAYLCNTHDVPLTVWNDLVNSGQIPNYSFISPNLLNDGHDTDVAYADNWLKNFLEPLLNKSWVSNTVFFITFDEGTTNDGYSGFDGGHTYFVAVSPYSKRLNISDNVTAYNIMTTTEWLLNLNTTGNNDSPITYPPMKKLFNFGHILNQLT